MKGSAIRGFINLTLPINFLLLINHNRYFAGIMQYRTIPTATSFWVKLPTFGRLCKLTAEFAAADGTHPPAVFVER